MKKIIAIVLLTATICSGADYSRFEKQGMAMVSGERVWSTWHIAHAECGVEMLDVQVPQEAQDYFYGMRTDEQGNAIPHEPLVLRDFILGTPAYSLDGTMCIISIAARHGPMYRSMFVTEQDMMVWDGYLTSYGFPSTAWLDTAQRAELLMSERYNAGGME
jgi:hypothetical protein